MKLGRTCPYEFVLSLNNITSNDKDDDPQHHVHAGMCCCQGFGLDQERGVSVFGDPSISNGETLTRIQTANVASFAVIQLDSGFLPVFAKLLLCILAAYFSLLLFAGNLLNLLWFT